MTLSIDPQLITWLDQLPPQARNAFMADVARETAAILKQSERPPLWRPNPDSEDGTPNPQRLAMESKADILAYGGSAGGGKTDLLLGLAATQHKSSVIFRRVFPSLRGIIERSREVFNPEGQDHGKDSFNESLHRWQLSDGRMIEFEACQYEKDKEKQRGRPRDFYGFDEVTEFTRSQFEFITAWNRSTNPDQRCRIVLTFNPPQDESGSWIIDYFLPWLAYLYPEQFTHPDPAKPGELRWYATVDGKEVECENGEPFISDHGEKIIPRSRSFIPARLADNPHLANTGYESVLQSLPEPLRSQLLYGDFSASAEADPWQVIPTAWVKLAQQRWRERERPTTALSSVGIDVARGGKDKTSIAKRYDNWYDEPITYLGIQTPDGPTVAAKVGEAVPGEPPGLYIDVIGIGSSAYDSLKDKYKNVTPVNVGEKSAYRDKSGKFKMRNKRAEMYWRMREALDPEHGDDVALPPGAEVVADLCAAKYKMTTAGIQIEEKEEIKKRIGRSPDIGESILLAGFTPTPPWPARGDKTEQSKWAGDRMRGSRWRR